jgi:hypothetical protein
MPKSGMWINPQKLRDKMIIPSLVKYQNTNPRWVRSAEDCDVEDKKHGLDHGLILI